MVWIRSEHKRYLAGFDLCGDIGHSIQHERIVTSVGIRVERHGAKMHNHRQVQSVCDLDCGIQYSTTFPAVSRGLSLRRRIRGLFKNIRVASINPSAGGHVSTGHCPSPGQLPVGIGRQILRPLNPAIWSPKINLGRFSGSVFGASLLE